MGVFCFNHENGGFALDLCAAAMRAMVCLCVAMSRKAVVQTIWSMAMKKVAVARPMRLTASSIACFMGTVLGRHWAPPAVL